MVQFRVVYESGKAHRISQDQGTGPGRGNLPAESGKRRGGVRSNAAAGARSSGTASGRLVPPGDGAHVALQEQKECLSEWRACTDIFIHLQAFIANVLARKYDKTGAQGAPTESGERPSDQRDATGGSTPCVPDVYGSWIVSKGVKSVFGEQRLHIEEEGSSEVQSCLSEGQADEWAHVRGYDAVIATWAHRLSKGHVPGIQEGYVQAELLRLGSLTGWNYIHVYVMRMGCPPLPTRHRSATANDDIKLKSSLDVVHLMVVRSTIS